MYTLFFAKNIEKVTCKDQSQTRNFSKFFSRCVVKTKYSKLLSPQSHPNLGGLVQETFHQIRLVRFFNSLTYLFFLQNNFSREHFAQLDNSIAIIMRCVRLFQGLIRRSKTCANRIQIIISICFCVCAFSRV